MRPLGAGLLLVSACMGQVTGPEESPDAAATATDSGTPETRSDAGSPDAGSLDAGSTPVDAGPGDAGCAGAFICDDFESDAVGATPQGWGTMLYPSNAGAISIDTTRAHSGSQSVHIQASLSGTGNSIVQMRQGLNLTNNAYFGRFWLYMPVTPNPHHWDLVASWGHLPGTAPVTANEIYYQYGGSVQIGSPMLPDGGHTLSAYYLSQSTDCEQSSLGWMPPQQWVCVEWQFDGVNDEMSFWLDGQLVPGLSVTNPRSGCGGTWTAPTFERLDLGWYNPQPQNGSPLDMWIDDVAAGYQRIGCGP